MRAGLGPGAAPLLVLLVIATASPVLAQVNLPPPPPPPLDNGTSGTSTSGSSDNTPPSATHKPKPHKAPEPAHTAAPPPTAQQPPPREVSHEPPPRVIEPETQRATSIRFNPLPLFAGRLSADLEFLLAPHHALVVSPNVTFHKVAFGRNDNTLGYGLGFAGDASAGFGGEIGYHYWVRRHLQGIYLGPSLILGATLPSAPAGAKAFAYYGGAFDVGYQYLFSNGFTLNGGGGILIIDATPTGSTLKAAPRFLFGIGWSF